MQLEFFDVPSPCVGVCQSNEKGLCLGCMRNREERLQWRTYHSDEKQKVIKRCQQRLQRKKAASNTKVASSIKAQEIVAETIVEPTNVQPSLLDPPAKKIKKDVLNIEVAQDDFDGFEL